MVSLAPSHYRPSVSYWCAHCSHTERWNLRLTLLDVNTQAQYQMMDDCFVGLIFSCYNQDASKQKARIQVTAFQSVDIAKQQDLEAKKKASVAPPQPERLEVRTRHTGTIPAGLGAEISVGVTMIEEREVRRGASAACCALLTSRQRSPPRRARSDAPRCSNKSVRCSHNHRAQR